MSRPLKTLPADSSSDEIVQVVQADGACIVDRALDVGRLDAINAELEPWMARTLHGNDEFVGHRTRRTGALVARSPLCRELVMDPTVVAAANGYLQPFCNRIQVHLTQTIAIDPGETAQLLHRDRLAWGGYIPRSIEPQLNTIWALTDFTTENGATNVIPGSHLWDDERKPDRSECVQAEMSAGSVLVYSGSVVHSGGANLSDATRVGLNITYCLSWLRQEENQFLSCPPEVARDLDPALTDLLGYTMANYALGYYSDPVGIQGRGDILGPETALGRSATAPDDSLGILP